MIGAAIRWIRVVLPPAWAVVVFVGLYLLPFSHYLWLKWSIENVEAEALNAVLRGCDMMIVLAASGYGVFRVWAFHPAAKSDYREWLAGTPWTLGNRLPLGPVQLVVQDVVILAVLALLLPGALLTWDMMVCCFLFSYMFRLALVFFCTGDKWASFTVFIGLALALRVVAVPYLSLVIVGACYFVTAIGLHQQMGRFPWTEVFAARALRSRQWYMQPQSQYQLGWPFDVLHPFVFGPKTRPVENIILSFLAGWWVYVGSALIIRFAPVEDDPEKTAMLILGGVSITAVVCAVFRIWYYCGIYRPPINLWGRIFTLRWVVPDYDYVFLAPMCIMIFATAAPPMLAAVGLPGEIVVGITQTLVVLSALNMGPSFDRWILTGNHRIVPSIYSFNKQQFERI